MDSELTKVNERIEALDAKIKQMGAGGSLHQYALEVLHAMRDALISLDHKANETKRK